MMMETLPPGTVLYGRYRIERVLGSGGFGHVYLAVDLQTNQQYAIKEYLVAGASGKAQLEHEARVLGHLHHPNLPAFQAAFDERGRYFVVLGYIEGSDLTDYIRVVRQRNEVVPLARIMTWIISICDAVTFLHGQNPSVIHRDIKPDNIRITPNGTAILVDLGNAKAAADGARTLFFLRHQGTPGYAPLEQYPGGSGTDTRSDVYALGGTLYFALTTHEPPSVSTRNQSIQQGLPDLPSLQEQLAHNPPETSGEPGGRQFRLGVSKPAKPASRHSRHLAQLGTLPLELLERLNAIIKQAMAMKPNERYHSVAELSNDLKSVLAALPTTTQPPTVGSARPIDPHRTQPDLPMLYETLQNAQKSTDQTPQDTSAATPTTESQPPLPPASTFHCPRCNAELLRQSTFCPHCGSSLTNTPKADATAARSQDSTLNPPSSMNPAPPNNRANPANSAAPKQVISPQLPRSTSMPAAGAPQQAPTASPTSNPTVSSQNMVHFPARTSGPPQAPLRPFIQSSAPTSLGTPKVTQAPPAASKAQPTNTADLNEIRKILFLVVIVLSAVLLFVALFFLFKAGHHLSAGSSEHHYYFLTQVGTYERILPLCITPTAPSTLAGLRARGPGIPRTSSVTERMVGSRAGHTPGNHRDWLT
jgi:serine/threonine protein kinase